MDDKAGLNKINKLTSKYAQGVVALCQELIQTPSVNGVNSEDKIINVIAKTSENLDLPHKLISKNKKRPNIFVGNNFNKKTGLLLIAHVDTVPVGDEKRWEHKPFGGEIENGKLYGRGAIDCKAGIVLSLYTLKILKDLGKLDAAKFAGVVDEESGADSELGARYMLKKGLNAGAAIYTYPGYDTVTIGHRGGVRLWVEVTGEAVHTGSLSWQNREKGANAIEATSKFVLALSQLKMPAKHKAFPGYGFVVTPTIIEGGSGESIVPDRVRILVDARLLPNNSNEEYIEKVKEIATKLEDSKIRFEITVKNNVHAVVISPKEKIVKILVKLDNEIMGIKPEVKGCGPWNEGYMFIGKGIPTVCGFGAKGYGVHSADEYLEIDSVSKVLEMYVRAALEYSGVQG